MAWWLQGPAITPSWDVCRGLCTGSGQVTLGTPPLRAGNPGVQPGSSWQSVGCGCVCVCVHLSSWFIGLQSLATTHPLRERPLSCEKWLKTQARFLVSSAHVVCETLSRGQAN